MRKKEKNILWFEEISYRDIELVGGKNASLGEMFNQLTPKGINIPNGFALTSNAYWLFVKQNKIDEKLERIFSNFDPKSITSLQRTGKKARSLFLKARFPKDLQQEVVKAYRQLGRQYREEKVGVAIRSSGVAEDAPDASFAGQFETFLNVEGDKQLLFAIKKCLASAFNNRAIAYREEKGFPHLKFVLSVGVQKMVRSDLASSGVMFTLDTETGFKDVVLINSIWGVGEMIVKGKITPDQFYVFKPTLEQGYKSIILKTLGRKTKKFVYGKKRGLRELRVDEKDELRFSLNDKEILTLAKWACEIERHYNLPQDIEWAKDGKTNKLFIVQSRPETVHTAKKARFYEEYKLETKKAPLLTGIAIGEKIGWGKVRIISDVSKIAEFKKGEVLVTRMTDPDWVSIFPLAAAIVTQEGGRTCHAAIVSREMGIPCIVGVQKASEVLKNGQMVTVDCTQGGKGRIFAGEVKFKVKRYDLKRVPNLKTKIMMNIGAPEIAFKNSFLPNDGVGLAREEFIIAEKIRVHPLALYHFAKLKRQSLSDQSLVKIVKKIEELTIEHRNKKEFFVKELAEGIAQIAAAFYPKEVIVRFSDFKTNEYKNLIGGELFEKEESNPMLGYRGASRYLDPEFKPAFKMECQALRRARDVFGLKNIAVMIPFCRTVEEGRGVLELMKEFGLEKGKDGLRVYIMCEIPSNVVLAEEFLKYFDGMSIGSNDLTQLVLGLDRDNPRIAHVGDERNQAIKTMVSQVIKVCNEKGKYSGICGQSPSDFPEFAQFLVDQGITGLSLNPDVVIKTILHLSKKKS
jgi:pyruvate,water dikinase